MADAMPGARHVPFLSAHRPKIPSSPIKKNTVHYRSGMQQTIKAESIVSFGGCHNFSFSLRKTHLPTWLAEFASVARPSSRPSQCQLESLCQVAPFASKALQTCHTVNTYRMNSPPRSLPVPSTSPFLGKTNTPRPSSSHRDHPSYSTEGLAPVLVTSLSGNLGHSSHSKSAAAGGFIRPGSSQIGNGGNGGNDRGSSTLAALGSLGSQRNLKVGSLLKGTLRTGGSTELLQYPREALMPAALNAQVRQMSVV